MVELMVTLGIFSGIAGIGSSMFQGERVATIEIAQKQHIRQAVKEISYWMGNKTKCEAVLSSVADLNFIGHTIGPYNSGKNLGDGLTLVNIESQTTVGAGRSATVLTIIFSRRILLQTKTEERRIVLETVVNDGNVECNNYAKEEIYVTSMQNSCDLIGGNFDGTNCVLGGALEENFKDQLMIYFCEMLGATYDPALDKCDQVDILGNLTSANVTPGQVCIGTNCRNAFNRGCPAGEFLRSVAVDGSFSCGSFTEAGQGPVVVEECTDEPMRCPAANGTTQHQTMADCNANKGTGFCRLFDTVNCPDGTTKESYCAWKCENGNPTFPNRDQCERQNPFGPDIPCFQNRDVNGVWCFRNVVICESTGEPGYDTQQLCQDNTHATAQDPCFERNGKWCPQEEQELACYHWTVEFSQEVGSNTSGNCEIIKDDRFVTIGSKGGTCTENFQFGGCYKRECTTNSNITCDPVPAQCRTCDTPVIRGLPGVCSISVGVSMRETCDTSAQTETDFHFESTESVSGIEDGATVTVAGRTCSNSDNQGATEQGSGQGGTDCTDQSNWSQNGSQRLICRNGNFDIWCPGD